LSTVRSASFRPSTRCTPTTPKESRFQPPSCQTAGTIGWSLSFRLPQSRLPQSRQPLSAWSRTTWLSPSWLLCARRTVFSESVQGVEPREARTDNDCVVVLLVLVHVTDRSSVEPSLPLLIGT
jgi:hypothetical protein